MAWDQLQYLFGGRLERLYLDPILLFKYHGFEWIQPGPPWAMRTVFWILTISALGIAFGFFYRLAATVFWVAYVYVFLLDVAAYNNHNYLVCLLSLLMIFVPAHCAGSLDARRWRALKSATVPAWALWLLRFQIGMPYFYGGIAKLNPDWLLRAQPMTEWLTSGRIEGTLKLSFFNEPWAGYFFSWSGFLLDLLIVPALLYRKTRILAFLVITAFHVTNSMLFTIGFFPWLMICATTLFFEPDWPRRVGLMRKQPALAAESHEFSHRRWTLVLMGAYVLVHLLLPFRHFLYPGYVDWTEEGHHFAWRMKVRDKVGEVRFAVVDRNSQQATLFEGLESIVTRRQYRRMVHDPELIRQFAHHLARKLRESGRGDFEIRAITNISFNGRPPRPLVDPNVDLASMPRHLGHAEWILPFEP